MTERQHLPPCCAALRLDRKDTPKAHFKTELAKHAASAQHPGYLRLAATMTEARSALQLDRSAVETPHEDVHFAKTEDITTYIAKLTEYLALLKGFTLTPSAIAAASTDIVDEPEANPLENEGEDTNKAVLAQPLMKNRSPRPEAAPPVIVDPTEDAQSSRTACLDCCSWSDLISNATLFAANASIEYAQVLLASALFLMDQARLVVDKLLAGRLNEINENELKVAYQLYLHAAGVLEACLRSINVEPRSCGPECTDLSKPSAADKVKAASMIPTDDMMERWRLEQSRVAGASMDSSMPRRASTDEDQENEELATLKRVPDLVRGRFPQVLAWIALAEAEELVILRGISRGFVDFSLMAKLAVDVAQRYKECFAFASRHLPCAESAVAGRIRAFCAFKDSYYKTVSCYFQGAACMAKEDGQHCAQAIADFNRAKTLVQESNRRKQIFDGKVPRDEKDRQFAIKTIYIRTEQIIQRDLEIMTRRNDTVYYERIPEPEPACDPINLVRPAELGNVEVHALWHDPSVASCLRANTGVRRFSRRSSTVAARPRTRSGQTRSSQAQARRRNGCCNNCIVS